MVSASGGGLTAASLAYDVQGRLYSLATASTTTRFLYDGVEAIAEYDGAGTVLRRYVRGAGVDDVIAWYEGSETSDKRFLTTDAKGSVTAVTNSAGNALAINKYDEYGVPAAGNLGRFQYTGQMWIAELGLYYYKARFYNPETGRFMQTDPIGLSGGLNLYAYTGNDPVNATDPNGLASDEIVVTGTTDVTDGGTITVTGARIAAPRLPSFAGFSNPTTTAPPPDLSNIDEGPELVVTAEKEKCGGPVVAAGGGVTAIAIAGFTVQYGVVVNPRTGKRSRYLTVGGGLGLQVGVGGQVNVYKDAPSFSGYNQTVSAEIGVRPIGSIGGSASFTADNQFVGGSGNVGPLGLGLPGLKAGVSTTVTYTIVTDKSFC